MFLGSNAALVGVAAGAADVGGSAPAQRLIVEVHDASGAAAIGTGAGLWRSALPIPPLDALHDRLLRVLEPLEAARRVGVAWPAFVPAGGRYVPTASSLSLDSEISTVLELLDGGGVLSAVERSLGGPIALAWDHAWVRRQFPPKEAPSGHFPHAWHQDGALGYSFSRSDPPVLLPMATCWIPLVDCGTDAPGLSFLEGMPLQSLDDLAGLPVDGGQSPELRVGDLLLFGGGAVHRTQTGTGMRLSRTSVELRFFREDRWPARIKSRKWMVRGTLGA